VARCRSGLDQVPRGSALGSPAPAAAAEPSGVSPSPKQRLNHHPAEQSAASPMPAAAPPKRSRPPDGANPAVGVENGMATRAVRMVMNNTIRAWESVGRGCCRALPAAGPRIAGPAPIPSGSAITRQRAGECRCWPALTVPHQAPGHCCLKRKHLDGCGARPPRCSSNPLTQFHQRVRMGLKAPPCAAASPASERVSPQASPCLFGASLRPRSMP